jgi:non-ribosomal peptide synthetase component F
VLAAGPAPLRPAALSLGRGTDDGVPGVIASVAGARGGFSGTRDIGVELDGDVVLLTGDPRQWRRDSLERMARHLGHFAEQAAAHPARRVADLDLLSEEELRRIAVDWNATDTAWPGGGYLELIAEHARTHPETCAVVQDQYSITFAEFDRVTNQIAHRLRRAGVADGDWVGLFCPRSADHVSAAIGILKAGAAIVPLDPVNPDPRIRFMLADCAPQAVLTVASLRDRLPGVAGVIDIGDVRAEPATPVVSHVGPDGLSHLIYTSGSTGEPKAVLERRAAIENLVHWTRRAYGVRAGDRVSWLSTPGFGVQIMEWMPYLALGVTVCVPELTHVQSPERIRDWLVRERVTRTMLVAALAEPAWSLTWPDSTALRIMVTTAERVHSWPPVGTPFRVVMTYGTPRRPTGGGGLLSPRVFRRRLLFAELAG